MKFVPETANFKQSRIFAWVFWGEVTVLISGAFGLTFGRPPGLRSAFFVMAASVLFLHAFLIWAWGRRYALIDWVYVAWNISTIAIFIQILMGAELTVKPPSATSVGMYIGRPSTFIAFILLLIAIITRSAGVIWSAMMAKGEFRREDSRVPAYFFLSVFVVGVIGFAAAIARSPIPSLDLSILFFFLGGGMDGVRIFL